MGEIDSHVCGYDIGSGIPIFRANQHKVKCPVEHAVIKKVFKIFESLESSIEQDNNQFFERAANSQQTIFQFSPNTRENAIDCFFKMESARTT